VRTLTTSSSSTGVGSCAKQLEFEKKSGRKRAAARRA
jgi:hypothetical protein